MKSYYVCAPLCESNGYIHLSILPTNSFGEFIYSSDYVNRISMITICSYQSYSPIYLMYILKDVRTDVKVNNGLFAP